MLGLEQQKELLLESKTIALVGLSPKVQRPSYQVAIAMQQYGYRIIPVRPAVDEILSEQVYTTLANIPFKIDLVNIFRASEYMPALVEECIDLSIAAIWAQEGVSHEAAASKAEQAGIQVVMDKCILKQFQQLIA